MTDNKTLAPLKLNKIQKSLSDRYLSSKINYNKGDFRGISWENWEVTINFIDGYSPNYVSKSYKKECSTEKEAKQLQSRALSIVKRAVENPDDEFFKQIIFFEGIENDK